MKYVTNHYAYWRARLVEEEGAPWEAGPSCVGSMGY